jgi:phosphatidylserine decarboxylase
MRIPLAVEGTREMLIALAVCVAWAGLSWAVGWPILAILGVLLLAVVLMFFRDPNRRIPGGAGLILSAADGRVTHVEQVEKHPLIGGPAVRISVFLSVASVHVNRSPCGARVIDTKIREGLYLDARDPECADKNASCTMTLAPAGPLRGPIVVRQLTGKIARRIVCNVAAGDRLDAGQKFGMIKFGSRTDVIVPQQLGLRVLVRVGDKVRGGTTVLARIAPTSDSQEAAVGELATVS